MSRALLVQPYPHRENAGDALWFRRARRHHCTIASPAVVLRIAHFIHAEIALSIPPQLMM